MVGDDHILGVYVSKEDGFVMEGLHLVDHLGHQVHDGFKDEVWRRYDELSESLSCDMVCDQVRISFWVLPGF